MAQGCSYLSESYVAGSRSWEGNPPVPPRPAPHHYHVDPSHHSLVLAGCLTVADPGNCFFLSSS